MLTSAQLACCASHCSTSAIVPHSSTGEHGGLHLHSSLLWWYNKFYTLPKRNDSNSSKIMMAKRVGVHPNIFPSLVPPLHPASRPFTMRPYHPTMVLPLNQANVVTLALLVALNNIFEVPSAFHYSHCATDAKMFTPQMLRSSRAPFARFTVILVAIAKQPSALLVLSTR